MSEHRRVIVKGRRIYVSGHTNDQGRFIAGHYKLLEPVEGTFIQWGLDVEEGNGGEYASFTVAIVELDDGSIELPRPVDVKFLQPLQGYYK